MPEIKEHIKTQSELIVKMFKEDGFNVDETISSIIEIDRFLDENTENGEPKKDGRLHGVDFKTILFSIGSYLGEIIIKNVNGAQWITNDQELQDGDLLLKLPNGIEIKPVQKVIKRFQNGKSEAVYPYVYNLVKDFINEPFKINATLPKYRKVNFEKINIRKIDSKNYKLNEDYIFSYDFFGHHTDNISSAGIYINLIFECKVDISFRKKNLETVSRQFECEVPTEIKSKLSEILNLDYITLKHYYSHIFLEGFSTKDYVINHNGVSHNASIGTLLKKLEAENDSEKLFFDLTELIKKWQEEIYHELSNQ
ncbi:hypothetical protein [Flavobacterium reichenbachii]|uniref:hypothetical protein n=1 Tax=Flavobacterium reichenbachii TaxID=362418 RepID=UPI000B5B90AD|nr:hypothetical protein [Flavobacterium reichenbachii]OXB15973.1 hypothetical protein B0A68_06790 [Flavobacterium reichenbachii]